MFRARTALVALLGSFGVVLWVGFAQAQTPTLPLCVPLKPTASATASAKRCSHIEARNAARDEAAELALGKLTCRNLTDAQIASVCNAGKMVPATVGLFGQVSPPPKHFRAVPRFSGQCIALRVVSLSSGSAFPPVPCPPSPNQIQGVAKVAATCGVVCRPPR